MCRKGNKKVTQNSKRKNPSNVIYEEASKYPAKITHNHLFNIYHLNEICGPSKAHPNKFKNTNCTNPFCLLKIGLERWEKFRKPPKTDEPKRDKPRDIQLQPCGLYNNANLCYLNSFLQIWYHNPHFRHFVFSYASVPTFVNPKNSSGAVIKVQKIMERLQAVFFALEVSPFEACDAVRLAEALMLQDGQQDVSEFHTLFFAFLEKQLEGHQSLPGFKKVHEKINFRMKQIIECPCKRKKVTENVVSGLHVSPEGCTNVTEMLKKCFAPAPLHGYTCPECNEEGITHMRSEVGTLPPVLMIQITRVSVDHRKDRTAIIYPRELNESTLLKGSKGNHKYHLIAVCVHDGQAASSGHYYDYIYDTRRKKWFHFNDATVKSIKPPGVETENDVIKPTTDMRGCYLLLYRRDTDLDADEDEEIPYNKLPKRAYVIEKRLGIESERLRNSNERSERYWHKRTAESLNRLEKLFNELKISTTDFVKKKPNDVVFLPVQLLLDIVDKEHKAVETMINLNKLEDTAAEERKLKRKEARAKEQADVESSGNSNGKHVNLEELERLQQKYLNVELTPQIIQEIEAASNSNYKTKRNGRIRKVKTENETNVVASTSYIADSSDESDVDENEEDEATYSHLYVPEKLETYEMPVCIHGKVPLMNVLKGEIKVVKKIGAEKLLENYELKIRKRIFKHSDSSSSTMASSTLMTGNELCVECATDLRKEANFSASLDEVEPTVSEILKDLTRQVTQESNLTSNDFIVSKKDLSNHRKLALQQREYNKLLELDKECSILIFTTTEDEKLNGINGIEKEMTTILSPKSRKRKSTNELNENEQISPKVEFMVQINPTSPLKLKMIRIEKSIINGEITKTNGNCMINGNIKAPVASEESNSETEEDDEMESDGEDDPDWDGHEGDCSNKRKSIRSTGGTPKKKRKLIKTLKNLSDNEQEIIIPKQPVYFNSNITCSHGNVINGGKVVRLNFDEWTEIVTSFFNDPTELRGDQMLCYDCEEEKQNELMSNRQNKDILTRINGDINLLLKQLEKRKFLKDELGTKFTNIICGRFLDNFKAASKSKSSTVTVPLLCQGCLICSEHGKPFVDFSKRQITGNAMPITSKEWKDIYKSYKNHFPGHDGDLVEIKLGIDGKSTNFCSTCCQQFLEKESKKKYEFINGEIYIKVQGDDDSGGTRKSQWRPATRRAAAKNFFKVTMSSNQKVSDLKLEICERYYCIPDQQLLYNNGDVLEDDKTLEESQIGANNVDNPVILIVQSREDGLREVDRGFQDTALGF